jgi:hypothetical protein
MTANETQGRQEQQRDGLAEFAPGLARIAVSAWLRTLEWSLEGAARAGSRLAGAAFGGEPGAPGERPEEPAAEEPAAREPGTELRERGAELLRRSADVDYREEAHPAYVRILDELAPDEARILRLLATKGSQPAVDVRSGLPFASELVAPGLTMIGADAGCRDLDRVHAYLNNLNRLGLIWFSRESLRDPLRYQVLEAQPEVIAPLREGGRLARTVRRSIALTPFGADFCEVCLPPPPA